MIPMLITSTVALGLIVGGWMFAAVFDSPLAEMAGWFLVLLGTATTIGIFVATAGVVA